MPPYFSGTGPPSRPSGAILRSTSLGKTSPRSRSRAPGAISLSAKSFASLRMDCCSEVRSKSTPLLRRSALRGALADREQRVDLAHVAQAALEDAGRAAHRFRGGFVIRKRAQTLRQRRDDRVDVPQEIAGGEAGDREDLLEGVAAQNAEPVITDTARVVASALGPAIYEPALGRDRKSTRLNSSHTVISYAVFCLKKKTKNHSTT